MPKVRSSLRVKLFKVVKDHKEFTTDGQTLYCKECDKRITFDHSHGSHYITSHLNSKIHQENCKLKSRNKQTLLLNSLENAENSKLTNDTFNLELTSALVKSGIPLFKINNPALKEFFENKMKRKMPDESTLRKNCVPPLYDSAIEEIRKVIGFNPIYLIVDETTDSCSRYVLNILVGPLNGNPHKPMLFWCKFLEKTNNITVSQNVNDALRVLWPENIEYEKLWLVVTDQASYMLRIYN